MKSKAILALLLTSIVALTAFAENGIIRGLTVRAEDQKAVVEWNSGNETGVIEFRLLRSFDGLKFHQIAVVKPEGSNHFYRYTDGDLFKERANTYYYRIQIVMATGRSEFTETSDITFGSSSVRRTWGSIKALFR